MSTSRLKDIDFNRPAPEFNKLGSKAQAYGQRTNLPQLVHPHDKTSGQGVEAQPTTAAVTVLGHPTVDAKPAPEAPKAKPIVERAPLKRLAVFLPDYLITDIHQRALTSTARFVVTQALKKAGFHVAAADLVEDKRRAK